MDKFTPSPMIDPQRKLYTRKRKQQFPELTPISGGGTIPVFADSPALELDDYQAKYTVNPFSVKISQFGKISYLDEDIMNTNMYDPVQDRSLHCFNCDKPILKISNVRSLKRKAGTGHKVKIKPNPSSASKSIAPEETAQNTEAVPSSTTTATPPKKTSTTPPKITTTTPTKNPNLLKRSMPSLLPASKASENLPLEIPQNLVAQDPNGKSQLHVVCDSSGELQCTWKITENSEIVKNNPTQNLVSTPVVPLAPAVSQENTRNVVNDLNTVQIPVPSGNKPVGMKCIKVIHRIGAVQKENPAATGNQPVVLKRLKILNPCNVKVGIHEIIRHLETVGLKPGKTIIKTVATQDSTTPNLSGLAPGAPKKCNTTLKKLTINNSASTMMAAGPHQIIVEAFGDATSSSSHPVRLQTVPGMDGKKLVKSQVLEAALTVAKSRKKVSRRCPRRERSPDIEPGSENLSFLYLKVEEPYPDEHGNLVEPSMSLIERSLNQDSRKAEDTTTWTTKSLDALKVKKCSKKLKSSKSVKSSENLEKRDENEEANELVPEREPSPDVFEDHSYHRPATPASIHEESSEESTNEAEEANCSETDMLDKVYSEARRYLEKPITSSFLPPPIDPEDAEGVIEYLTKKLQLVQKENKALEKKLASSKKIIQRMKNEVFQYKLARGFKAKKEKKKAPDRTILEKSMEDLDLWD